MKFRQKGHWRENVPNAVASFQKNCSFSGICPTGFAYPHKESVYFINTTDAYTTWDQIRDKCYSYGSHVHSLSVETADEQDHIALLSEKKGKVRFSAKEYVKMQMI